jgi:hypothetical protein
MITTRTLGYVDLRGAPWVVLASSESGEPENDFSANSIAYKLLALKANSLTSILDVIDTQVKSKTRAKFEESSQHYPQAGFEDSLSDHWDVEYVSASSMPGYYATQWGTLVGPAPNKPDLKKLVEQYVKRLDGEKSTTTKYGAESDASLYFTDIDINKPIERPNASDAPGKKVRWELVIPGLAAAGWILYRIFAK